MWHLQYFLLSSASYIQWPYAQKWVTVIDSADALESSGCETGSHRGWNHRGAWWRLTPSFRMEQTLNRQGARPMEAGEACVFAVCGLEFSSIFALLQQDLNVDVVEGSPRKNFRAPHRPVSDYELDWMKRLFPHVVNPTKSLVRRKHCRDDRWRVVREYLSGLPSCCLI